MEGRGSALVLFGAVVYCAVLSIQEGVFEVDIFHRERLQALGGTRLGGEGVWGNEEGM